MLYSEIIAVTNRKLVSGDFYIKINEVSELGVKAIILREKDLTEEEYQELAKKVQEICYLNNTTCILHTYYNVAIRLKCRNIHLPLNILREIYENTPNLLREFDNIGVSTHSVQDAVLAQKMGATYITFGHVFDTDCKKGLKPRGTKLLNEVCNAVDIPVYGIGGIDETSYDSIIEAGAHGACIMSKLMK